MNAAHAEQFSKSNNMFVLRCSFVNAVMLICSFEGDSGRCYVSTCSPLGLLPPRAPHVQFPNARGDNEHIVQFFRNQFDFDEKETAAILGRMVVIFFEMQCCHVTSLITMAETGYQCTL